MSTLHLCGAGNSEGVRLALRVNEARPRWDRIVLLDDDPAKWGRRLLGVEVTGPFGDLAGADPSADGVVNLVARTTEGRRRAGAAIEAHGVPWVGLVSPGVDTLGARLADDVLVYPGAIIGPESDVGPGSVVFMGAVVGHESRVGPACVIAANAVLNARVELGAGVYVGANATILPEVRVGAEATVGAGSAVVDSVDAGSTVMGVPARPLGGGAAAGGGGRARPEPGEVEAALVAAWADALDGPPPPLDAPVFDLGATSLAALRVAERVRRVTGLDLAVVDLFRFATIGELAAHLTGGSAAPVRAPRRPAPSPAAARPATAPAAGPVSDLVATVTGVFRDVLGEPALGPDSHFFDRGGDPDAAQHACRLLQQVTGEPLCFMQVARYPTPRELARHIEAAVGQPPACPAQGVMNRLIHRHEWQRG